MSISKKDLEELKPWIDRTVQRFLGFSEPALVTAAINCLGSGYDRKKTTDKLASLLDEGKASKLAEKLFETLDDLKVKSKTRKRHKEDVSETYDYKRNKKSEDELFTIPQPGQPSPGQLTAMQQPIEELGTTEKEQCFKEEELKNIDRIRENAGTSGITLVESLPFDATANSPHSSVAASVLNTCRIEDEEESVNSSPDLALRHNLISNVQTRCYFPSVFLDDFIKHDAPSSVTTHRRKFDTKKYYEATTADLPISVTTVIKKDACDNNDGTELSIKTTVNRSSPVKKSSNSEIRQNLNPTDLSSELNSPFCMGSQQLLINNSVSAYRQYITSHSDAPSKPLDQTDKNVSTPPVYKPRLIHNAEQVITSTSEVNKAAVLKSKSVGCGMVSEKIQPMTLKQSIDQFERYLQNRSHRPTKQALFSTKDVPLSPEYVQVTAADTRAAVARVLAARKIPNKTKCETSLNTPSSPAQNRLSRSSPNDSSSSDSCANASINEQLTPNGNLSSQPTWDQVGSGTELMLSDEKQKIVEEQQELLEQLRHLKRRDDDKKAISPNSNSQFCNEEHTINADSSNSGCLSEASNGSNSLPEMYVCPKPPVTILCGMDRTPHELTTIWEADTLHSVQTSVPGEVTPLIPYTAPPYFDKTRLQKLTGEAHNSYLCSNKVFGTPTSPTSRLTADVDSPHLASTPKQMPQFHMSLLGDVGKA